MFHNSEVHRGELQVFIKTTTVTIQNDSGDNKTYQDTLIGENSQLRQKIQRMEEKSSATLQESLRTMDEIKQHHYEREQENATFVNSLRVQHAMQIDQITAERQ